MRVKANFRTNLEELFDEYAWKRFNKKRCIVSRIFSRRSKYYVDVRWRSIEFTHETKNFTERSEASNTTRGGEAIPAENSAIVSKDVVLYQTDYKNETPVDQEYTFSSTRVTTSSTTIELQDNYTTELTWKFEVKVPGNNVTAGVDASNTLSFSSMERESFESSTTWTVDTKIKVNSGYRAEAKVCVSERYSIADFKVETTMKIADGKDLPIAIRRVSDNEIVHVMVVPDLREVFHDIMKTNKNITSLEYWDESVQTAKKRYKIIMHMHGTCKSTSWKNQHVEVNSVKIGSNSVDDNE